MAEIVGPVFGALVGGVIGFLAALFAEPLRQWLLKARLSVEFGNSEEYRTRTLETKRSASGSVHTRNAIYTRLKITNVRTRMAKRCLAFLARVEEQNERGEFERTLYSDSIPLAWSCKNPEDVIEPLDLPKGVTQFVDVVSSREQSAEFQLEIKPVPLRYNDLFKHHGTYRFTVEVAGDNIDPVFACLVFRWDGKWDAFEAHLQSVGSSLG